MASFLSELYKAIASDPPHPRYWSLRLPNNKATQEPGEVWPCVVGRVFNFTPDLAFGENMSFNCSFVFSLYSLDLSGVEMLAMVDSVLEKYADSLGLDTAFYHVTFVFDSCEFSYDEELYQADLSYNLTVTRRS